MAPGEQVTLDGPASSDPDGDRLTFAWSQTGGASVSLTQDDVPVITVIAPTSPQTLAFSLTVCDGCGNCATDSVDVVVAPVPAPPPAWVGLAYSPYRQHERPKFVFTQEGQPDRVLGLQPTIEELEEDADILAVVLGPEPHVRVYSAQDGPGDAAAVLAARGVRVSLGLSLSTDDVQNQAEIDAAIALVDQFPGAIVRLIAGNETQGTGPDAAPPLPLEQLVDLIREVKARLDERELAMPIAAAEVLSTWLPPGGGVNETLVREVDEIVVHIYGYFDGIAVESSVDHVYDRLDQSELILFRWTRRARKH